MTRRLFVAVELTDSVRDALARTLAEPSLRDCAPGGLRWLPEENWHLTLRFLGPIEDARLEAVGRACAGAAAGMGRFELELAGASAFASPRRAHSIWFGVGRHHAQLAALAQALSQAFVPLGFPPESRAYVGHVTIARVKPPADVRPLLARLPATPLALPVSALSLVRSETLPSGARYRVEARFALADPA